MRIVTIARIILERPEGGFQTGIHYGYAQEPEYTVVLAGDAPEQIIEGVRSVASKHGGRTNLPEALRVVGATGRGTYHHPGWQPESV